MALVTHQSSDACALLVEMSISLSLRHSSPLVFAGTHDNWAVHAGNGSGSGRSSAISRRMSAKWCIGIAHLESSPRLLRVIRGHWVLQAGCPVSAWRHSHGNLAHRHNGHGNPFSHGHVDDLSRTSLQLWFSLYTSSTIVRGIANGAPSRRDSCS